MATDVDLKQFWNEKELEDLFVQEDSNATLEAPEPKIDQAAQLQRKWKVTRGQLWEIGPHRLMCADCTAAEDVARLMGKQKARVCATDPPYLVSYDAKNHPSKSFSDGKNKDWKGRYADKQRDEPLRPFYESFLQQALAVCDAATAFYIWHASQRQFEVEAAMRASGILVHQQIVWAKNKPVLTHFFYMWQHEPCFFGWKKGFKPRRKSREFPTTVWQVDVPILPGHETRHPTEKPLKLFAIPIRMHTAPGDVVYEPFSGSGTQLAAAENLQRRCYAMEIEPGIVAVALEQLAKMGLVPKLVKQHSHC